MVLISLSGVVSVIDVTIALNKLFLTSVYKFIIQFVCLHDGSYCHDDAKNKSFNSLEEHKHVL